MIHVIKATSREFKIKYLKKETDISFMKRYKIIIFPCPIFFTGMFLDLIKVKETRLS